MTTPFEKRAEILSEVWMDHRNDADFEDFVRYNDLGLPMAYATHADMAEITPLGIEVINETFDMLLEAAGHEKDTGFDTIYEILDAATPIITEEYVESISDDDEEGEWEVYATDTYKAGYRKGFKAGSYAEQERVQSIAQMNMKWAKQQNKGNEYMKWHNVSEILKPMNIDPNFDDEDF